MSGHQHHRVVTGNSTFLEVDSMVVSWWMVAFLPSVGSAEMFEQIVECSL